MNRISNYKGDTLCHLFSFLIAVTFLFTACGDFVREDRPPRDIVIYSDTIPGYDTLRDINTPADTDTEEPDSGEEPDTYIPTDIIQDSDIIDTKDVFEDTKDTAQTDISEDSLLTDILLTDSADEPDITPQDIYPDTDISDGGAEPGIDADIPCYCDAGSDCGICYYPGTENLTNKALKDKLNQLISNHTSLGYDLARTKMFSEIDNKDGWVECVYTGFKLQTSGIPNSNIMNTEHTWPQSMGADNEPARSDLFHLFPTKSDANSRRGSYPFGTVVNVTWSEGGSKLGTNSKGNTVFEPRDVHKGNVARAIFYFSIRYKLPIDADQESELRKWHTLDPVDTEEIDRCNSITGYQKNRNPFVDWPPFVDRIEDF